MTLLTRPKVYMASPRMAVEQDRFEGIHLISESATCGVTIHYKGGSHAGQHGPRIKTSFASDVLLVNHRSGTKTALPPEVAQNTNGIVHKSKRPGVAELGSTSVEIAPMWPIPMPLPKDGRSAVEFPLHVCVIPRPNRPRLG